VGRNDLIWNGDVICRKGSVRPLITIDRDPGVASVNLKPRQRAANNDAGLQHDFHRMTPRQAWTWKLPSVPIRAPSRYQLGHHVPALWHGPSETDQSCSGQAVT